MDDGLDRHAYGIAALAMARSGSESIASGSLRWRGSLFRPLFFSLSGSKIPGYVLPVLPAAALLIAERISFVLKADSASV